MLAIAVVGTGEALAKDQKVAVETVMRAEGVAERAHLGLEQAGAVGRVALVHDAVWQEVLVRVPAALQHPVGERAEDADDAREHARDRVVLEEHVAGEQLGEDGAQRPHVLRGAP